MPKVISTIITYVAITLVVAGAVTGSFYLYNKNNAKSQTLNSAVQSFDSEQKQYQDAVNKLKDMKDTYIAQSTLNSYIVSQYAPVEKSFLAVDVLVSNAANSDSLLNNAQLSTETKAKINTLHNQIQAQLNEWKNTIQSITVSSKPSVTLVNQVNNQVSTLQSYVSELQTIVSRLTPDTVTTPQQINTYQTIVNNTQQSVQAISNNITQAETIAGAVTTGSTTVVTPVTQSDIQNQQTVVNQISTQVSPGNTTSSSNSSGASPVTTSTTGTNPVNTINTGNTSTTGNTSNTSLYVPPPPQPGDTTTPKLIEGTNKY